MVDTWLQSLDDGKIVAALFLDLSTGFDVINNKLLLEKLQRYGFSTQTMDWFKSYLTDRSQAVQIESVRSPLLSVPYCVPQGSILGPLFYTLFKNELPEIIHDSIQDGDDEEEAEPVFPAYHMSDEQNGSIICYADDTTFTCTDANPVTLSNMLTAKCKIIAQFMANNRLKLNDEKTHLLVMTTAQARGRADNQVQMT